MSSAVSADLRQRVALRADHLCEYCLVHEEEGFLSFQVDHLISLKNPTGADAGVRVTNPKDEVPADRLSSVLDWLRPEASGQPIRHHGTALPE